MISDIPSDMLAPLSPEEYASILRAGRGKDISSTIDTSGGTYSLTVSDRFGQVVFDSGWVTRKRLPREIPIRGFRIVERRGFIVRLTKRYLRSGSNTPYAVQSKNLNSSWRRDSLVISARTYSDAQDYFARRTFKLARSLPVPFVNRRNTVRANPEQVLTPVPTYILTETGFHNYQLQNNIFYKRQWSGTTTPGFHSIRRRALPNNPHHVDMYSIIDNGGIKWEIVKPYGPSGPAFTSIDVGAYSRFMDSDWGQVNVLTHDLSKRNRTISRLASRAHTDVQNLAETVATVGQTVRLIQNNLLKIARAAIAVKQLNFAKAAAYLWTPQKVRNKRFRRQPSKSRSLAENWLEYQYGFKPLLQDISYSIEAVARLNLADYGLVYIEDHYTNKSIERKPLLHTGDPYFGSYVFGSQVIRKKTSIRMGLTYGLEDSTTALLAQSGFLNPISLAWELIPFSFVSDWVLPLGPYLESLSHWKGLKFIRGWEVNFTRHITDHTVDYHKVAAGGNVEYGGFGNRSYEGILFDRMSLSGFPTMGFPSFKNPLSVTHALNAVALVKTIFGK